MMNAATALRTAVIAELKANTEVRLTALGASPRVFNRVLGLPKFPFLVVKTGARAWDTTGDRGAEVDLMIYVEGEFAGDEEGEAIFAATRLALRDFAPRDLTDHKLVTCIFQTDGVRGEENNKRYFGMQRWRAATEEAGVIYVPPPAPPSSSLAVEEEERQARLAAEAISALRVVRREADGRVSLADQSSIEDCWAAIGVSENAAGAGAPLNVRTSGVMVDGSWTWTAGAALFLGAAGVITNTAPTSGVLLRIGTALSATAIHIDLADPIVLA